MSRVMILNNYAEINIKELTLEVTFFLFIVHCLEQKKRDNPLFLILIF